MPSARPPTVGSDAAGSSPPMPGCAPAAWRMPSTTWSENLGPPHPVLGLPEKLGSRLRTCLPFLSIVPSVWLRTVATKRIGVPHNALYPSVQTARAVNPIWWGKVPYPFCLLPPSHCSRDDPLQVSAPAPGLATAKLPMPPPPGDE